jgi:hypothetical protein
MCFHQVLTQQIQAENYPNMSENNNQFEHVVGCG